MIVNFFILIFVLTIVNLFTRKNYLKKKNSFFFSNVYQKAMQMLVEFISKLVHDNIIEENEKYFPFILVVFFFLLLNNFIGLLPYSFTITSHMIITFILSFSIFIGINIVCFKLYKFQMFLLFLPPKTSFFLSFLIVPIEFVSYIFRPISLGVRLFANIMAGHTLLKVIIGFSWSITFLENYLSLLQLFPSIIIIILLILEFSVAIIQAYVFIILICIYINDTKNLH